MSSSHPPLTQARLKELLHYNPETGVFTRVAHRYRYLVGSSAGGVSSTGYVAIKVDGVTYQAHRLAFLYMLGSLPATGVDVDHINRVRDDNRWVNLRLATRSQNRTNTGTQSNNTSGFRGVRCRPNSTRWQARGRKNNVHYHLGFFDTAEEAAAVAQKWREENFKEFACIPNPETLSPNPES